MRKRTWARLLAAAMALYLLLPLFGCGAQDGTPQSAPQSATETERLVKLCKVWGYVKYTHSAFLLGQKDWDEELLALVPQVRERETQEEVNALLHDWFVSLGEIDYGRGNRKPSKVNKEDWVIEADTSWTRDAEYLGEDLTADLAQLPEELPSLRKEDKAPVFFDEGPGTPNFSNEQDRAGDYDDIAFRLLGLFRLWNGIEYYFPYLHLMDRSWESCLPDAIESMMAGTDQASYEEAIYALTGCLQDNHVMVENSESKGSTAGKYFGSYMCGYDPSVLQVSKSFYPWEKPVVVLMDKTTLSFSEMAVTIFSTDENVTVLGENSMGSDGNVVYLPLPGGISVSFTSLGCYEVDGTQTQRTGITPDIPVSRTIQGVKEGRDELMEAAVQYLTEHE